MDDIKVANGGDVLFVATTISDYELMSGNVQELRRYIRELGEVIVYYRNVTMLDGEVSALFEKRMKPIQINKPENLYERIQILLFEYFEAYLSTIMLEFVMI